ncbi:VOC family protein [Nonomuraea longicatena]|uniref:VOC domain-containing protein n=1 Tax=Nonomuraea longicatena TaxID=83682 RepID=A0ABP4AJY0_9ACTN
MRFSYAIVYVSDVVEAVDFYERAFGFARAFVHESGDFAQLATGGTALAFTSHRLGAQAVPVPYTALSPAMPPVGLEFTFTTEDVAGGFARAVAAGATAVAEPHETAWGQVVSYVRDPYGVLVGIASPVAGFS